MYYEIQYGYSGLSIFSAELLFVEKWRPPVDSAHQKEEHYNNSVISAVYGRQRRTQLVISLRTFLKKR